MNDVIQRAKAMYSTSKKKLESQPIKTSQLEEWE